MGVSVNYIKRLALFLTAALTLTACASIQDVSLSDYSQEVELAQADLMPTASQISDHGRIKVIAFNSETGGLRHGRALPAANTLTASLERVLGSNGVEIVDRKLAGKLDSEIKLAEMRGFVDNSEGPTVANFAIKSSITSAEYSYDVVPAQTWTDKKGKEHTNPAHFDHAASAGILIKVYAIPSLREIKTLVGTGYQRMSSNDRGNREAGMIRGATQDALDRVKDQLLNLFAPKGYILRKMTNSKGKKSIFQISIGSQQGLVTGQRVLIKSQRAVKNPITGLTSYESVDLVKASVSTLVNSGDAWIVPEDESKAANVRLGDVAEVFYKEEGFMSKLLH